MIKARLLITILLLLCAPEVWADSISVDLGDGQSTGITSRALQFIALLTVLSLAPAILMMATSFTRILIVLSFLRTAMGTQQSPPNMVITSLAMFLTFFIMAPTFQESYDKGLKPLIDNKIKEEVGFERTIAPFKKFMLTHSRDKELELFLDITKTEIKDKNDIPLHIVIPSFMLSEIKRAFEIGFLIFLPFLIIDMLVASTLMAMGMMMLPPIMIALPFKLIFFVLIDGWYMICGSLVKSYGIG